MLALLVAFYLNSFLKQFAEADGSWDRSYYYTNFEIVYMPFFRGRQYQSFFQDLDSTEGFYAHRWGDAPVRLLGLSMYAQPQQVKLLDLPYAHKVAQQQLDDSERNPHPFTGLRKRGVHDSCVASALTILPLPPSIV
jgi:hypothetical protein